nr:exosome complex component RRP41-like [Tanacetum cinerariifolium]GEZ46862.1 exosome complex component RRP41-like [Tanacetum cinerariifolium]
MSSNPVRVCPIAVPSDPHNNGSGFTKDKEPDAMGMDEPSKPGRSPFHVTMGMDKPYKHLPSGHSPSGTTYQVRSVNPMLFVQPTSEALDSILIRVAFGPRESKKAMMYSDIGRLNCNVTYTTFSTPVRGQGSENKEISAQLHKSLEGSIMLDTFPKTTVDVFALVLESGGCDLPVVISCASLALADAGIMMYDLVTAVSVSCLGKCLVIDPVSEEENYQDGSLMITCLPSRNEVTQLTMTGEWSTPKIHEAMELCLDACSKLGKIMRSCLKESASTSQE